MNELFGLVEIVGSLALAISGALTAIRNKFDGFGILIIAFVTAIGGGTLRDVLLPNREVFWIHNTYIMYAIIVGTLIAIFLRNKHHYIYRPLMLFDSIGLGFYTIVGVGIGISQGLDAIFCILIGTITGTFGGVLRDILVNKVPIIFHKEIYATISILGGSLYYILSFSSLPLMAVKFIPITFIILARLVVLKFELSLPSIYAKDEN